MDCKNDKYRLGIYTRFAQMAKEQKLKWVVAHGSEGYPKTIGRDLDVLCYDLQNIKLAIDLFKKAASSKTDTKWIVAPNPIWGRRLLAISNRYEVAELHILYKLNSGLLDCPVNWDDVTYQLFPTNKRVSYFKSVLMPLLGGSEKVSRLSDKTVGELPWVLRRLYNKIIDHRQVGMLDKLCVYTMLKFGNMSSIFQNYRFAKYIKSLIPISPTAPLFYVCEREIVGNIRERLNEVFLDFVCCDNLSKEEIGYHQARQRFTYVTMPRTDVKCDIQLSTFADYNYEIVQAFSDYNFRNMELYEKESNDIYSQFCMQ